jgi:hypothetical protein
MFGSVAAQAGATPPSISSDHDPLFQFYRWNANLRILEIQEIKTVPYAPLSHPFVERLIGTIRRRFLDYASFGQAEILYESSNRSGNTTTRPARIGPSMEKRPFRGCKRDNTRLN